VPQRRRYATRDEVATLLTEHINTATGDTIDEGAVGAVLDALAACGVDPDALVKILVDEPEP
jgi:hypothetical protein